jgi:peptidoglycan/xylan/chitin deacetylase (PgdA/CDA1 family)
MKTSAEATPRETTKTGNNGVFNPFSIAARGKGVSALFKRARIISARLGLTASKMDLALAQFSRLLQSYGCSATFPITSVVLARNSAVIRKYHSRGIEFAIHGYIHIDYPQLAPEEQLAHLRRAREIFAAMGITVVGFRSPYLRRGTHLYAAIEAAGFSYVSNQPVMWDVLDADAFAPSTGASYERAIKFYDPWPASERLSLPQLCNQLVEIPVSLPDDEMLLDRLGGETDGLVEKTWRRILSQTYQRGELFTIQLHPERIFKCVDGLSAILAEARTLTPSVWIARLDEIAAWWRARANATVDITDVGDGGFHLVVAGPSGTTVLARAVEVDARTVPWANGYRQVEAMTFTVHAPLRPFIGVSPGTSPALISFLRQQGYIVEISGETGRYSHYFDQADFVAEHERSLLAQIERTGRPLVRLGRWPNGARSALAVTGDIDALTLWDYCLRFLGR